MSTIVDQHLQILEAVKRGDGDAAVESIHRHLMEIVSTMPAIAKDHAELFEEADTGTPAP
jgi:DNA-binding GntR family transcriptional regulator